MVSVEERQAPALIVPIGGMDLLDQIRLRRKIMESPKEYTIWGSMFRMFFDPLGLSRPDPMELDHPVVRSNELSWEGENARNAPILALSRDDKSLLILGLIPPLVDITAPDAADNMEDWVPTNLPGWQIPRGNTPRAGVMPRRYKQRYSDFTTEFISSQSTDEPNFADPDCFFVIRPVVQIYMKIFGVPEPGLVEPTTAPNGTRMSFLVNPKTREAHLIGGVLHLNCQFHTLPDGAKP